MSVIRSHTSKFNLLVAVFAFVVGWSAFSRTVLAEDQIEAIRAPFYVGKNVLACGRVAQVTVRSNVTYINLDRPYPNHTLGLVIWQSSLTDYESRLGKLSALEGRRVCARGLIEEYRSKLQIIMRNPQFLRLMSS
jgi:DNA/RNA endonuclease YhcR with UshA esterase domain